MAWVGVAAEIDDQTCRSSGARLKPTSFVSAGRNDENLPQTARLVPARDTSTFRRDLGSSVSKLYFKGVAHYRCSLAYGVVLFVLTAVWVSFFTGVDEVRFSIRFAGWLSLLFSVIVIAQSLKGLRDEGMQSYSRELGRLTTRGMLVFWALVMIIDVALAVILIIDKDFGPSQILRRSIGILAGSYFIIIGLTARASNRQETASAPITDNRRPD